MASLIKKSLDVLNISTIHFTLVAILGAYVRSCNATSGYCGNALYLWEPITGETPDFLLTAQVTSIIHLIASISTWITSKAWLNYERSYGLLLLIGIITGATNVIFYWVATGNESVSDAFDSVYGASVEDVAWVGLGTISSGIAVIIQILLLFFLLLTGGK